MAKERIFTAGGVVQIDVPDTETAKQEEEGAQQTEAASAENETTGGVIGGQDQAEGIAREL